MPRIAKTKQPVKERAVKADIVLETKLSAIVSDIDAILKPFNNTVTVEVDKANGVPQTIRIKATIINPR